MKDNRQKYNSKIIKYICSDIQVKSRICKINFLKMNFKHKHFPIRLYKSRQLENTSLHLINAYKNKSI